MTDIEWFCHCCSAKNPAVNVKCRVCGRLSSYAMGTDRLPFHGKSVVVYHPSQVSNILSDVREIDSLGWTATHNAAAYGNAPLVAQLILLHADVNATTEQGHTALHLAVHAGSEETVKVLIENGADVNKATDFEKSTPLHIACEDSWKGICKLLIDSGAEADLPNVMQRTPLHAAASTGQLEIGAMLIKAGASIFGTDMNGWNPRQIAELNDHRKFQELLVRAELASRNEKSFLMKELPVASWHCPLWTEMIETQKKKKSKQISDKG